MEKQDKQKMTKAQKKNTLLHCATSIWILILVQQNDMNETESKTYSQDKQCTDIRRTLQQPAYCDSKPLTNITNMN